MPPNYEYRCDDCEVTVLVPKGKDLVVCTCGTDKPMRRVYSLGGIAFKGSGFYKTDKDKK